MSGRRPPRSRAALIGALLAAAALPLAACSTRAVRPAEPRMRVEPPATEADGSETPPPPELPPVQLSPLPPVSAPAPACVCIPPPPKTHTRRAPLPKEPEERETKPAAGAAAPAAPEIVDAEVGRLQGPLTSVLGKDVQSPKGEGLGRVVDLLADREGRVRVAIIDFGGFLGVGTRRIAVDWPLLHFNPDNRDKPLILSVTRQKLKSAPEYKDAADPKVLMAPTAADDAAGAAAKK